MIPDEFDTARLLARVDFYRTCLVDLAAIRCASNGWSVLALYGAGKHTRRYIRQPWRWRGLTVACVLDDDPQVDEIDGVPVVRPDQLHKIQQQIDAIVVSPDSVRGTLETKAREFFGTTYPIIGIYGDLIPIYEPGETGRDDVVKRLITEGRSQGDAGWLADNRDERHDASVGTLPPARTELHLRRYLLAARFAAKSDILDIACGTGYGSALLADRGAKSVTGFDIDPQSVAYAKTYHSRDSASFAVGDAGDIQIADNSIDLITSFETIEHTTNPAAVIAEFARVLRPGGKVVISTPNDRGLTDFHEHSITRSELDELLQPHFEITHELGQIPGNEPVDSDLPPGVYYQKECVIEPETLISIATKR